MSSSSACALIQLCVFFFLSYQDLGSSDGPPRNWKGIGIAMVVIVAVMSLVILSVILLTPGKNKSQSNKIKKEGLYCNVEMVLHFRMYAYVLSGGELGEKINTTLMSVGYIYDISTADWKQ